MNSPSLPADPEVQELRSASRQLVRGLGLLSGTVESIDCTPSQCHALMEISDHGQLTTRDLAAILEVDKSTASRTLKSLERDGLLEAVPDPEDQRTRPLRLSAAGRARVQRIHASANRQVREALDLLSEDERATVLRGVSLYEQALHRAKALAGTVFRPIEPRDEAAMAKIIRTVMAEFSAIGCGYSSNDEEVDHMHSAYQGERHGYFVIERNDKVLGGGGFAPLAGSDDPDVCELRKMHALPEARGLGLGRRLLTICLDGAREAGFRRCYLETLRHMHRARALYEKAGFRPRTEPLGETGHFICDQWFEKEL